MVGPHIGEKQLNAILIGTSLFVLDFILGWLRYVTAWVPMIFVLALIIGLIAGNIEDGTGALLITLIIGTVIGAFLLPFLWPPASPSGTGITLEGIVGLFIFAPAYAVRGWLMPLVSNSFDEVVLVSVLAAPGFYFLSFGFAAIGGKIAEYLWAEPEDTSDLQESGFPKNDESKTPDEPKKQDIVIESNSTN